MRVVRCTDVDLDRCDSNRPGLSVVKEIRKYFLVELVEQNIFDSERSSDMKRSFKLLTKRFAGARECCKPTSLARRGSVGPGCRPLCVQQSSSTKKVVGDDGEGGGSEGEGARGEG
jgi:hypothetical protein